MLHFKKTIMDICIVFENTLLSNNMQKFTTFESKLTEQCKHMEIAQEMSNIKGKTLANLYLLSEEAGKITSYKIVMVTMLLLKRVLKHVLY